MVLNNGNKRRAFATTSVSALLGLQACGAMVSDAEKRERQENAFDVSGEYTAEKAKGSDIDMKFSIVNESGRHNILATVERTGLTPEESSLLESYDVDPQQVAAHFIDTPTVLGRGSNSELQGGENVSDDFGTSTRFSVCSETFRYNSKREVYYCLNGSMRKDQKPVSGEYAMFLVIKEEREVEEDGKKVMEETSDTKKVDFAYSSETRSSFYKQYIGQWSGTIHDVSEELLGATIFTKIIIQETAGAKEEDSTFSLSPLEAGTLTLGDEVFTYTPANNQYPIADLNQTEFPTVTMAFESPTKKQILFVGQIWSLGDFTGSLLLLDGDQEEGLGSFMLKRD
ncbi:MAG: hypothetical protein AB7T49_05770 [Oligoflexales bacterium]